jgi:hypothetical protein
LLNLVLSKVDLQANPANPMPESDTHAQHAMHRMRSRARACARTQSMGIGFRGIAASIALFWGAAAGGGNYLKH